MAFQPEERYMRMAIEKCRKGIARGQSPFGACIVKDGQAIALEHNVVWETTDITAHAEVTAIRAACKNIDDIDLTGAVIYSTTEPCPMCFSASHWARIGTIVYGASIADAAKAGFNELEVSNEDLKRIGGTGVEIVPGFMRDECVKLFEEWLSSPASRSY
ncbi:MAG TPA: nucleoside deaminase [Candidatus Kapabacteria bacterium]|jgi:tRNA(Arg) A34 adenosine deaminase TadA|nr:nucleoside deaminase [Candidatus Kapabacteria bacterium]